MWADTEHVFLKNGAKKRKSAMKLSEDGHKPCLYQNAALNNLE